MPTADDFLRAEQDIATRVQALQASVASLTTTVGTMRSDVASIDSDLRYGTDLNGQSSVAHSLHLIATADSGLPGLIAALQSITPGGGGTITVQTDPALTTAVQNLVTHATALARLAVETPYEQGAPLIARSLSNISTILDELLLLFSPEAAGGSQLLGIRQQLARIGDLLAAGAAAGGGAGAPVDWAPLLDFLAGAFGGSGSSASQALGALGDLLAGLLSPAPAEAAEPPATPKTLVAEFMETAIRANLGLAPKPYTSITAADLRDATAVAALNLSQFVNPLLIPFEAVLTAGMVELLGTL